MGYSRFMAIGVERQQESVTVDEATRNYARSCECCMKQGRNFQFDCDCDCPITVAHREKLEAILTLRQLEHERNARKEREQEELRKKSEELKKKLDECVAMVEDIYEMTYCPRHLDDHNDELDELVNKWLNLKGGGGTYVRIVIK